MISVFFAREVSKEKGQSLCLLPNRYMKSVPQPFWTDFQNVTSLLILSLPEHVDQCHVKFGVEIKRTQLMCPLSNKIWLLWQSWARIQLWWKLIGFIFISEVLGSGWTFELPLAPKLCQLVLSGLTAFPSLSLDSLSTAWLPLYQ